MVAINYDWDELEDNIDEEYDDTGNTIAEYTTEPQLYGNVISQNRTSAPSLAFAGRLRERRRRFLHLGSAPRGFIKIPTPPSNRNSARFFLDFRVYLLFAVVVAASRALG